MQSISSADAARWTLLTLSHELLHAHVKGLFAIILKSTTVPPGDSSLSNLIQSYRSWAGEIQKDGKAVGRMSVLDFLRFRTFAFVDGIQKAATSEIDQPNEGETELLKVGPQSSDAYEIERFKNSFGYLNEIVVHVLDLHYFYNEAEDLYLSSLWKSWATVPGVADKLDWYILRSLVAAASKDTDGITWECFGVLGDRLPKSHKNLNLRFKTAVSDLVSLVEDLCANGHDLPTLRAVLARLADPDALKWLRTNFYPCYLFAEIVKEFFYSRKLKNYFDNFADKLAEQDEKGNPVYLLDTLHFPGLRITNPIAFLRDRLMRDPKEASEDEEMRSAWLLLALASVPTEKGTNANEES